MKTVFDPLRKKEVALTPEEQVRQAVIVWLNREQGIPLIRMQSEYPFTFNNLQYRADILVFDRNLNPEILVECKAPSVKIDQDVIEQIVRYTRVLKTKKIVVTNGTTTFFFSIDADGINYHQTATLQDQ